jgi:surface antigen
MAQDILKAIDGGSDLGTELTKINQQIQWKPEYKMLYNQTYRNPDAWFTESFTVWDTQYVKYNWQRYTADELNSKMWNWAVWNPKPYDVVSEEMFSIDPSKWGLGAFLMDSKNANGKYWWQCAKFVNNYLQQIWVGRYFWEEDIKTREQRANSDTPKVWTIAIFDYWVISKKTGKNHGHVAIVTQVNSDWSFVVKESNYPSWETIWTRTVKPWSTSLKWFFDPSKWASNVGEMETQNNEGAGTVSYNESRVWLYDRYINDWMAPSDQKLKGLWNGDIDKWWQIFDAEVEDYMNKTWAGTLDKKKNDEIIKSRTQLHQEQAYKDYRSMQSTYTKIESSAQKKTPQWDMSLIFAYMKMLDPNSVVREWEYATAQNAGNVWDKIINLYNNTITWEKLTENQRQEFLEMAKSLMDGATYNYNNLLDDYASQLFYGWDASKLGTKWTYVTQEYINKFWGETPQTTKQVNALDVVKSSLSKMSKNIQQSAPNTKAITQSKYWINN